MIRTPILCFWAADVIYWAVHELLEGIGVQGRFLLSGTLHRDRHQYSDMSVKFISCAKFSNKKSCENFKYFRLNTAPFSTLMYIDIIFRLLVNLLKMAAVYGRGATK